MRRYNSRTRKDVGIDRREEASVETGHLSSTAVLGD